MELRQQLLKTKPERVSKVEVAVEEQPKEERRKSALSTPRPKSKGPNQGTPPFNPANTDPKSSEPKKVGKGGGKGKRGKSWRVRVSLRAYLAQFAAFSWIHLLQECCHQQRSCSGFGGLTIPQAIPEKNAHAIVGIASRFA